MQELMGAKCLNRKKMGVEKAVVTPVTRNDWGSLLSRRETRIPLSPHRTGLGTDVREVLATPGAGAWLPGCYSKADAPKRLDAIKIKR